MQVLRSILNKFKRVSPVEEVKLPQIRYSTSELIIISNTLVNVSDYFTGLVVNQPHRDFDNCVVPNKVLMTPELCEFVKTSLTHDFSSVFKDVPLNQYSPLQIMIACLTGLLIGVSRLVEEGEFDILGRLHDQSATKLLQHLDSCLYILTPPYKTTPNEKPYENIYFQRRRKAFMETLADLRNELHLMFSHLGES